MLVRYIFYIIFLLFPSYALGISDDVIGKGCRLTPQIWSLETPKIKEKDNDLRYETGSPESVLGAPIHVKGYVLDEYCVPVDGANLTIWQIRSVGEEIEYLTGSTSTDSLGRFEFFSVIPLSGKGLSPKISINVKHRDLPTFETKMFFPQFNNLIDEEFLSIRKKERELLIASLVKQKNVDKNSYMFSISLEGRLKYKEF